MAGKKRFVCSNTDSSASPCRRDCKCSLRSEKSVKHTKKSPPDASGTLLGHSQTWIPLLKGTETYSRFTDKTRKKETNVTSELQLLKLNVRSLQNFKDLQTKKYLCTPLSAHESVTVWGGIFNLVILDKYYYKDRSYTFRKKIVTEKKDIHIFSQHWNPLRNLSSLYEPIRQQASTLNKQSSLARFSGTVCSAV